MINPEKTWLGWSLQLKPSTGREGKNASTSVTNDREAETALKGPRSTATQTPIQT